MQRIEAAQAAFYGGQVLGRVANRAIGYRINDRQPENEWGFITYGEIIVGYRFCNQAVSWRCAAIPTLGALYFYPVRMVATRPTLHE